MNRAKLLNWLTTQCSWVFLLQISILQEISSVDGSKNRAGRLARSGLSRSGRVEDAPGRIHVTGFVLLSEVSAAWPYEIESISCSVAIG